MDFLLWEGVLDIRFDLERSLQFHDGQRFLLLQDGPYDLLFITLWITALTFGIGNLAI